jgi:hypothetical protein
MRRKGLLYHQQVTPQPLDPTDPETHLPPAPPPAPREVTATVRSRAWNERHVRLWLLLGLAMFCIASYYTMSRLYFWKQEDNLIKHGQTVQAEVMGANPDADAPKGQVYSADTAIDLKYTWNGQSYREHGVMGGRTAQLFSRTMVPIIIDPADPSRWTGRVKSGSLIHEMLAAMMLVPFVIVLFALTLWRRATVLKIYQQGEAVIAEVVGVGHSAAAPMSRLLRCAVRMGDDMRVIKILLPTSRAPEIGETLWLIAPAGRADQAIPAALFE